MSALSHEALTGIPAAIGALPPRIAMFEIHLLGQPRFRFWGEPHSFRAPPRTLPLLAYLLLNRGAHLTRDSIAAILWPDEPEADGRANLRRHLHHLKETLPHPGGPWFVADGPTVSWRCDADAWLDVDIFEHCIAEGRLGDAVALYGGHLLPGMYDDWIIIERERLRSLYLYALERLTIRGRIEREFALTAEYARRLLAEDPWREDIVRHLMSARYESGDRAGALHEFALLETRLREEMKADPMAETIALRDLILDAGRLPARSDVISSHRRRDNLSITPDGRAHRSEALRFSTSQATAQ